MKYKILNNYNAEELSKGKTSMTVKFIFTTKSLNKLTALNILVITSPMKM